MPLKLPLFSPSPLPLLRPPPPSPASLRFSRWNNANAEPFNRRRQHLKQIEDDLRLHRRHNSAARILDDLPPSPLSPSSKSRGTPSAPSHPSIPGKKSKYSKPPQNPSESPPPPAPRAPPPPEFPLEPAGVSVGENGVCYRFEGAAFDYQYSYTETPKVVPLGVREPLRFSPFGPSTMPRPWTGRPPQVGSRGRLAAGMGLRGLEPDCRAASREEILGEPLSDEEVKGLVKGCSKSNRQLCIGAF